MTREDAIEYGIEWLKDEYLDAKDREFIKIAIKALKQESCTDCISRQAVLDIINFEDKWLLDAKGHNANTNIAFSGMKFKVSDLPPTKDCSTCKYCKNNVCRDEACVGCFDDLNHGNYESRIELEGDYYENNN